MAYTRPHEDRLGDGTPTAGDVLTYTGTGTAEWDTGGGGGGSANFDDDATTLGPGPEPGYSFPTGRAYIRQFDLGNAAQDAYVSVSQGQVWLFAHPTTGGGFNPDNGEAVIKINYGTDGAINLDAYDDNGYSSIAMSSTQTWVDAGPTIVLELLGASMRFPAKATAPSSPSEGDTYFDTAWHRPRFYDATGWQPVGAPGVARIVAAAAIANTETVVAAYSMPANAMQVGTTFRIKAFGRLTSGATAGSSIFRCRIGTTTLTGNIAATLTIANLALTTNAPFVLDMLVTVRTTGGSGTAIGNVSAFGGVIGAFTVAGDVSAISGTVVVDTTATKRVELTYISGNAGTTATFEDAVIEIANA